MSCDTRSLQELLEYVDKNTIESFAHQIITGKQVNFELKLTRRGFQFYAGIEERTRIIRCNFENGPVWESTDVEELKVKIREYMISKSIWRMRK